MTALLGVLVLSCMGDIAPRLQVLASRAVDAWAPYKAEVCGVRWCKPAECSGMGGGMFHNDSRVIAIDPDWPFKGDELLLTLEHEYGHALGLPHRWGNSIMKPGWDPPFAPGPTEEDFRDLRRMHNAGALLYRGGPRRPIRTAVAGRGRGSLDMNDSVLKLDSKAIERKLRGDFESDLAAWATSPPEAPEKSRQQLDKAQKRLSDLLVEAEVT